jgi:hypothetical protein
MSACSRATAKLSKSSRLDTAVGTERLRVMISKSKNLILSVTVRPPVAGALRVPPNLVDQRPELGGHGVESREVGRERVLRADGLANTIGAHGTVVDPARNPVIVGGRLAELAFMNSIVYCECPFR